MAFSFSAFQRFSISREYETERGITRARTHILNFSMSVFQVFSIFLGLAGIVKTRNFNANESNVGIAR